MIILIVWIILGLFSYFIFDAFSMKNNPRITFRYGLTDPLMYVCILFGPASLGSVIVHLIVPN